MEKYRILHRQPELNLFGFTLAFLSVLFFFNASGFADDTLLPSSIIRLPDNENAILVEKKSQTLLLYGNEGEKLLLKFKVACSTGEAPGTKQKAGDRKTPEGIYFLLDEYEDKYLSPIYGKKAFPTDYPNLLDRKAGKNGSAIWIHGTNKELKPMDSNGCVALEDSNVLKLSNYVNLDSTPVIMMEKIEMVDSQARVIREREIAAFIDQWIKAIEGGTYHDYLSFYSSQYLPDINWWEEWRKLREELTHDAFLSVEREQTGIYYHANVFVVLFDHSLVDRDKKIGLGKRKLFLEKQDAGYKIIGDTFQKQAELLKTAKAPLVAAAKMMSGPVASPEDAVVEAIRQWMAAWSAKDMDTYASFYTENFYSDGMSKMAWVNRKRAIAKKYNYIKVTGKDFTVTTRKNKGEISFYQMYKSSGFTTEGTKKLGLVKKGGLWKIYQESWKEK